MTIKEMEAKVGMTRANIRYYEAEGLIHPARQENGYRVYGEADAEVLLKIKLLRTLGVSLEDLRALQAGSALLSEVLTTHRASLSQEQSRLARNQSVADQILGAEESFETLNPAVYLAALEHSEQVLKQDVARRLVLPWRRYWARCFDYALYSSLINGLVFRYRLKDFLSFLFPLIAMALLEPLFLHVFATTPGKAIFGIRVTDTEGRKLSFGDALERTWLVLWEGEGLRVPFVSLYFLYKSYAKADAGQPLPWEADSDLTIFDDAKWRYGLFFGIQCIIFGLEVLLLYHLGG